MKEYIVVMMNDGYYWIAYKVITEFGAMWKVDDTLELNGFEFQTDALSYAYHLEKVQK